LLGSLALSFAIPSAQAAEPEESVMLIAKPALKDALYGSTILLAKAMPDGSNVGFILNKPTQFKLGQLFPKHGPSMNVADPIFLGGPFGTNVMFALVESSESPGAGSIEVAPSLFLAIQADTVDHIIETDAENARFLVGMVVWRPGELSEEMKRGMWYEMKPDAEVLLRKQTEGLWEELVRRSEQGANTI
jgi:putative transcriptional regulator